MKGSVATGGIDQPIAVADATAPPTGRRARNRDVLVFKILSHRRSKIVSIQLAFELIT